MQSTCVGTYEINESVFLFTFTGVMHDGIYSLYPEEIASEFKNKQAQVIGNTIILPSSYSDGTQVGIVNFTFELDE